VAALALTGAVLTLAHGAFAFASFLTISVLALAIGTLAHAAGLAGGGDVKFMAASVAVLGIPDCWLFMAMTFVAGGILAFAVAVLRGEVRAVVRNVVFLATPMLAGVRPPALTSGTKMPYSLAFFAGALAVGVTTFVH
jgi:Flp pilus assembly protein protease CpaA